MRIFPRRAALCVLLAACAAAAFPAMAAAPAQGSDSAAPASPSPQASAPGRTAPPAGADELLAPHAGVEAVPADPVPRPQRIAPGVYALFGTGGAVAPANRGAVANTGFIVGPSGVTVIDSGASYRYGKGLLAAIKQVTPLPVKLLIITHQAPEFVFGAAALRDSGVPILAMHRTAELIRARCSVCLKNLRRTLGDEQMRDSRVAVPDRTVPAGTTLDVGGRKLELLNYGPASTPGDLGVFDPASGVLFAGGWLSIHRLPELRTENIPGWLATLKQVRALPVTAIVPGFGPLAHRGDLTGTEDYLRALEAGVRRVYERGGSLEDAMQAVTLPKYRDWPLYSTSQPQNVQRVYLQFESGQLP